MSAKETSSKYELVPPDGGWGYLIGLGVILNLSTLMGFINCFGMLFKDLFIEIDMDSTGVTIFNGVAAFCVAISGFVASPLQKIMSLRQLGLLAAFIFNLGTFCTVFVNTKLLFILSQGILQGFGNGLIYNLSCTMLNNYFVEKRLLAFSLTQTISAVFSLLSPQFVKWSIENYGSQGTLLLVSAIYLHNIVGMALMQPVAWHMKKVERSEPEQKEMKLLLTADKNFEVNINKLSCYKPDQMEYDTDKNHDSKIKKFLSRFLDLSLFKTFVLSNACIGVSFSGFLEMMFIMLLPQALYSMGWNEGEVARAMSLNALGDLATRIAVIFMSGALNRFGSHETFVAGLVIAFVSRIGMLWSNNNVVILTFITLMGISRCTVTAFVPVVVADAVGQEKFTSAIGMLLMLFGLFNCTVGPVIGAIRDLTDSYSTAFYVITSCFGVIIISWSIELLYKRAIRNRMPKIDGTLNS